ncbi:MULTISPECIES: hypothetical protein [unclassified Microcoleus]|uniref:hypothetical protein n=1 Tax=unclassified Microcoleus TaxID=2642155 RepID=UPI0025EAFD87|nr:MULTISPECIES: hypothetical protein [unclassified Microcoleus]
MSARITISPSEIRQIFQPRTSSASRFWELAQKANNLAVIIEDRWEKIPAETQELLKIFAYTFIEPPQGIKERLLKFVGLFSLAIALPWILLKGEFDSYVAYKNALDRIVNAILSEVEREDMAYQKALSEALEETFTEWETSSAMTAEEACERIRAISNQALE